MNKDKFMKINLWKSVIAPETAAAKLDAHKG